MRRGLGEKTDQFAFQSLQPAIKIQGRSPDALTNVFYTPPEYSILRENIHIFILF